MIRRIKNLLAQIFKKKRTVKPFINSIQIADLYRKKLDM